LINCAQTTAATPAVETLSLQAFRFIEESNCYLITTSRFGWSSRVNRSEHSLYLVDVEQMGAFSAVEGFADSLGAAVGAWRAATDAGWYRTLLSESDKPAKRVSPQLYVACGISRSDPASVQEMQTSKTIVVINKDPEAPLFEIADFGVVTATCFAVLPKADGKALKPTSHRLRPVPSIYVDHAATTLPPAAAVRRSPLRLQELG